MRYLREHTKLNIVETDEEVMKANSNVWPDDKLKNEVLVPQTTKEIITRDSIVYFASYIPDDLIAEARQNGFKIIVLNFSLKTLDERNKKRMQVENYEDVSPWFKMQLDNYKKLKDLNYIDVVIDGNQSVETISEVLISLTKLRK